ISSVAVLPPGVAGWNATATEVDPLPAIVVVDGAPTVKSAASVPVIENGGVRTAGVASVLVIVSVAFAVVPGDTGPKSTGDGDSDKPPAPLPVRGIVTVPAALLVIVSDADCVPLTSGWNVTFKLVDAPAGSVVAPKAPVVK